MNIEVTSEQAIATRYALLLHTKEDSDRDWETIE